MKSRKNRLSIALLLMMSLSFGACAYNPDQHENPEPCYDCFVRNLSGTLLYTEVICGESSRSAFIQEHDQENTNVDCRR